MSPFHKVYLLETFHVYALVFVDEIVLWELLVFFELLLPFLLVLWQTHFVRMPLYHRETTPCKSSVATQNDDGENRCTDP
jgi:hypothetical protein